MASDPTFTPIDLSPAVYLPGKGYILRSEHIRENIARGVMRACTAAEATAYPGASAMWGDEPVYPSKLIEVPRV